jgi:hypothetical protein
VLIAIIDNLARNYTAVDAKALKQRSRADGP